MKIARRSPGKVNLLLNILRRREDGFHDLETIMQPVPLNDELEFTRGSAGIELACDHPQLPVTGDNLVHRAATAFLSTAGIADGVRIRLQKQLPLAAGLGGGSSNAAHTLRGLNELFGQPLPPEQLHELAAALGSDVPFFLQDGPALATGRGERVEPLPAFPALRGRGLLLVHPGFGVSTAWAYRQLARHPAVLNGRPGRARELIAELQSPDLAGASAHVYNSLEAPVLPKHPLLQIYQDFLRDRGAVIAMMSGSGSTTFALTPGADAAEALAEQFRAHFGGNAWLQTAAFPA